MTAIINPTKSPRAYPRISALAWHRLHQLDAEYPHGATGATLADEWNLTNAFCVELYLRNTGLDRYVCREGQYGMPDAIFTAHVASMPPLKARGGCHNAEGDVRRYVHEAITYLLRKNPRGISATAIANYIGDHSLAITRGGGILQSMIDAGEVIRTRGVNNMCGSSGTTSIFSLAPAPAPTTDNTASQEATI